MKSDSKQTRIAERLIYDFPDYTKRNPWQSKSLGPTGEDIVRSNTWPPQIIPRILHISWEDVLIKDQEGDSAVEKALEVLEDLDVLLPSTRLYWTVHNLTSHRAINKEAEKILREGLAKRAYKIILMSEKHVKPLLLEAHRCKIEIIPHYIEYNPLLSLRGKLKTNSKCVFFKYGDARDERDKSTIKNIIDSQGVSVYVSDKRFSEFISEKKFIVPRRFTSLEANLYSAVSTFSLFNRNPQLNSGVMNFYIGSYLAVFHDIESVKYMDLPDAYAKLNIEELSWSDIQERAENITLHKAFNDELCEFINMRLPFRTIARYHEVFEL